METSFLELKQKEVVNLCDGKRLGKVCDVVFLYPEGRVQGIVVPGGRGLRWGKADLFIDLKSVTKIGVDVVLVEIRSAPGKPEKKRHGRDPSPYGSAPPAAPYGNALPPAAYAADSAPGGSSYPPGYPSQTSRRDLSEYE